MLFFFLGVNASQKNLVVSKHISAKCLGEFKEIYKLVWNTLELPNSSRNEIISISIFGR